MPTWSFRKLVLAPARLTACRRVAVAGVSVVAAGSFAVVGAPTAAAFVQSDVDCALSLVQLDCAGADLSYYSGFSDRALLPGKNVSGANVTDSEFIRTYAPGLNLSGASMFRANFGGAILTGANLTGVLVAPMSLAGADLSGANLAGANLGGTDIQEAVLSNADLSNANMTGVDLADAKLTGSNLTGTMLRGSYVKGADFGNVVGLTRTEFDAAGTVGTPAVYPPDASVLEPPVVPPPPAPGWGTFSIFES